MSQNSKDDKNKTTAKKKVEPKANKSQTQNKTKTQSKTKSNTKNSTKSNTKSKTQVRTQSKSRSQSPRKSSNKKTTTKKPINDDILSVKESNIEKSKSNNKTDISLIKRDDKDIYKKEKKSTKRIFLSLLFIVAIFEIIYGVYLFQEKFKDKFQDIEIEIASVTEIKMEDFLVDEKYKNNSIMLTDLTQVDFTKVGEYKVKLSHSDKEEEVTLKLVDTTAPTVKFQDLTKYIDYKPSADDFIVKKEDLSEMETTIINAPTIDKFGDYDITVEVKDIYGNKTTNDCKLFVRWIKQSISIERGQNLNKKDLLFNEKTEGNLLNDKRLKEIANSDIGVYEIETTKDGVTVKTQINVTDLTPPTLEVKDVSIYDDEIDTLNGKDSFIVSTYDASRKVTTKLKKEIDFSNIGTQDVIIEAVDKYNNKTEKTAKLTIMRDTIGPIISGLSQITIESGSTIDLRSGVSANDDRDGVCDFQVDDSGVNTKAEGTYYATYTAKDKRGNVTTSKREIVVNHSQEDTDNKFDEYDNQIIEPETDEEKNTSAEMIGGD